MLHNITFTASDWTCITNKLIGRWTLWRQRVSIY